jgi:hypothetical protein
MTDSITVVGGGIAGLIAAIECAEVGAPVRLLEARSSLGGRGTSTRGPWTANYGPHALYVGGPLWEWLIRRDLVGPWVRPPVSAVRFRWDGERRALPPLAVLKALPSLRTPAPVDRSLHDWLAERHGEASARAVAGGAGVLTFDHDPGRLSARFVMERVVRITAKVPARARYPVGGWRSVIARMTVHARRVGVEIETGVKVDDLPSGPVIVAVEPRAARALLPGADLAFAATRTALLDVGLAPARRRGPNVISDLDEGGFANRVTGVIPALGPVGHDLIQVSLGMRPDETLEQAVSRIETLLDVGWPGWREREVWRRRINAHESSGALDLPGTTWRDRPAIDQGDGVWLAGDWVAAPGHLAEVSCVSAIEAARSARAAGALVRS